MGSHRRFEDPCDAAPNRPRDDRAGNREEDMQGPREAREVRTDPDRRDEPDPVLALATDVEQPASEGEGNGQRRQHERRHHDEGLLEVHRRVRALAPLHPGEEPVQPGAVEDRLVGGERVVARDRDDQSPDDERENGGREWDDEAPGALVEAGQAGEAAAGRRLGRLGHQAAFPRTPPVIAIPRSSSETFGPYSPTIRPS